MALQITAHSIKQELESRGYDVSVIQSQKGPILSFMQGDRQRYTLSSSPDLSSGIATVICNDKLAFDQLARSLELPIPDTQSYVDETRALEFMERSGSIVVKPVDGAHGNGISTDVSSAESLQLAIRDAKDAYPESEILLQRQVSGEDYRLLMIDGQLVAAAKRVPAMVTGNGVSTIEQLILDENAGDKRTVAYSDRLCKIDETKAWSYLKQRRSDVPGEGESVQVVGTANIGSGGYAEDVTDDIPQHINELATLLVGSLGAFVCGVDFMHDESSDEWHLIEANTAPSFGLHMNPQKGESRPVVNRFVDALLAD